MAAPQFSCSPSELALLRSVFSIDPDLSERDAIAGILLSAAKLDPPPMDSTARRQWAGIHRGDEDVQAAYDKLLQAAKFRRLPITHYVFTLAFLHTATASPARIWEFREWWESRPAYGKLDNHAAHLATWRAAQASALSDALRASDKAFDSWWAAEHRDWTAAPRAAARAAWIARGQL